jgi:N4-gp56 family major capsid protein
MADVITGNTQLGTTKQEIIAAVVQKELKFRAKLLPFVSDVSMFAGKGMKSVSFPKLTSFTAVNRASGVAGDATALTASVDKLNLDQNAYVSWIIDSMDETQTTIDAQLEFAKRAAAAHGRYVDEKLLAVIEAAAGLTAAAGVISQAKILDAREELLKNEADMSKVVLCIAPDVEKTMLGISDFVRADAYGSAVLQTGVIGYVYGVPVMVHTGVSAGESFMWDKDAVAIAFQKLPQMGEQEAIQYGVGAKRVAIDQLFGSTALQLGEKGKLATQSPLIVKVSTP